MSEKHGGQTLTQESVAQLRQLDRAACEICGTNRSRLGNRCNQSRTDTAIFSKIGDNQAITAPPRVSPPSSNRTSNRQGARIWVTASPEERAKNRRASPLAVSAAPPSDGAAEGDGVCAVRLRRTPPQLHHTSVSNPRLGCAVNASPESTPQQTIKRCHRAPSSLGPFVSLYLPRSTNMFSLHRIVSSSASLL